MEILKNINKMTCSSWSIPYYLFTILCCISLKLSAQNITIKGLVTEGDGNPLAGVSVAIKNTTTGTFTDVNGRYTISAKTGNVLIFSYLGFVTEERTIKDETNINIRLTESSADLSEVVVVGYGQQKKESLVSSISTVTAKDLAVTGRSLSNSIAGKLAGIIARQPSGEPGYDDSNFWIRGVSSFAGGTSPLIIIDGIPRSKSDMSNIPVDEIESFSVLKDAAATAVYGAEGANGVILVNTKRGASQKTVMSVNAEHAIRTPIRTPQSLDSYRTLNLYNEATWNEAGNPISGWLPTYDDVTLSNYLLGKDPDLYPNTNWLDLLKPNTNVSRYTVNFRGGADKVKFFTSGAFYTEDGLYHSNTVENYNANLKYERYNLRSNIDMELTKTTKMSVDLAGYFVKQNAPMTPANDLWSIISMSPRYLFPMVYSDGSFAEHPQYSAGSVGTAERANPYNLLNNMGYTKNWTVTVQSRVNLVQNLDIFTKGLSWRGALSFDALTQGRMNRTKEANSFYAKNRDDNGNLIFSQIRAGSALGNPVAGGSSGERKVYVETALDYKRTFGKHDVTGLMLYNQKETQYQSRSVGLEMLPYRKQSVVARVTYGFDRRYLLEASMGMTGSENFAAGNRWGSFPAIGAAWWISNENFWDPLKRSFEKLKLRVSYGKTGNDVLSSDMSRFPYRERVNEGDAGYNYSWTGGSGVSNNGQGSGSPGAGIVESDYATPTLGWEIEDKFNTGFDIGFFNGRIDASIDYFYNERHDILIRRNTIPTAAGLRVNPMQNFGRTKNRGIDLSFVGKQALGNFMLTGRLNYTYTKNKIMEYDEIPQSYTYQAYTGQSIGQPFIYIAEGLYTPDDFIITKNANGSESYALKTGLPDPGLAVAPGDIRYKDLNGDGKIDSYDQTYANGFFSTTVPGIVYGFGLTVEWKRLSVGAFFQGADKISSNLLNKVENFFPFQRSITDASLREEAMNRWRYEDPYNQDVLFPRIRTTGNSNNTRTSTWWYRDASYIRLKNIELGYAFNPKALKKAKINGLRLYVQGENLYTWDKIKFWDPEVTDRSGARYPISATWTFGLDVTF
ncbi:TonB-dependent receptor plug [Pseudopedobacter saltans DSM 12145]|uniref:TonB-dependent receptor plug n=1 Tax=Pseudopedobacter saltans (strain ATCC 51119 / DSM 12145 / JCM 21818 / CCUG 39354 / LMG 10337 / NBRC 100064 / NCIMB 13643) TaxID=762903 RepID=F0S6T0_PSESL|nr:TonB-dependent receptor [Pseudopedobacter saltans]ADY52190.1 TonB-dependent receptor plug [Pseudopedobacter saltans DSM 12145]